MGSIPNASETAMTRHCTLPRLPSMNMLWQEVDMSTNVSGPGFTGGTLTPTGSTAVGGAWHPVTGVIVASATRIPLARRFMHTDHIGKASRAKEIRHALTLHAKGRTIRRICHGY
jgi:hypothetical protein